MFGIVLACVLGTLTVGASPPSAAAGAPIKRLDSEVGNLTVVIDGPGPTADVGVPFTLAASLGDAIGPFVYIWNCAALGTTHTATWTVRLLSPGPARFSLEVGDAAGDVSWANLSLNATNGPLVAAEPVNRTADSGIPLGVALAVSEGVAPYRLRWAVNGNPGGGAINLSAAATVIEPVWINATGPVWVTANVTDAVGGSDDTAAWVSLAAAAPALTLALPTGEAEVGVPFHLSAAVLGGTPPISWTVGALGAVTNSSASHGILAGAGTVSWNATPTVAGSLAVWIATVDTLGVVRSANGSFAVAASVNVSLVVLNRSLVAGAAVNVSALIAGGIAPYTVDWSASSGAHGTDASGVPGPLNWTVPGISPGFFTIVLTVHDADGGSAGASATGFASPAPVPPPPPVGSSPNGDLGWVLPLTLGAGGVGAGVWWWHGHRRARAIATTQRRTRADRMVADAIRGRNGIDVDDLHGLGDAQSLFPEEVAEAVNRLVAAGRVRVEYDTGDPVYFWTTPAADGPTTSPGESDPQGEP